MKNFAGKAALFLAFFCFIGLNTGCHDEFDWEYASGSIMIRHESPYGSVAYNWDDDYIRRGSGAYGSIVCNIDGKYIRSGS